jgi:hypothetical protein
MKKESEERSKIRMAIFVSSTIQVGSRGGLEGTVAQDFLPLVFSTNRPHIVPEFTP